MNPNIISSNQIQVTIDSEYTMNLDLLRGMVEIRWACNARLMAIIKIQNHFVC
jgi:hypothetical protein